LHCPGENYLLPDGTPDYSITCSGHGTCIDGISCMCDSAWDGFSDDCSQLACPREDVTMQDGTVQQVHCSGVGACYNDVVALNASCDANGVSAATPPQYLLQPNDYVNFYVDCASSTMTIARCLCANTATQSAPKCEAITLEEGNIVVLDPAGSRARPFPGLSTLLATALAVALLRPLRRRL